MTVARSIPIGRVARTGTAGGFIDTPEAHGPSWADRNWPGRSSPRMRNAIAIVLMGCSSALLPGCVSVDPRASTEVVDRERTRSLAGEFENVASYRSQETFIAAGNLARLFHVPAREADRVRIDWNAQGGLRFTWFQGTSQWDTVEFARDSIRTAADGSIELPERSERGGTEGAYAATRTSLRIFITPRGELAVIETHAGAGVVGIVPVGVYTKHLALFPPVR